MTVVPVMAQILQQLCLHVLAGHLVESAERLVHQQQWRVRGERPGNGDALLHAARELPRHVTPELGQLDEVEHLLARARRLARSHPFSSSGSSMFFDTVRQSNKPAC